jgi:hypothetical protein
MGSTRFRDITRRKMSTQPSKSVDGNPITFKSVIWIVAYSIIFYGCYYLIIEKNALNFLVTKITPGILMVAAPIVTFLVGYALFLFRQFNLFYYSITEIGFGMATGAYVVARAMPQSLANVSGHDLINAISLLGAIFIVVRGLDNLKKSKSSELDTNSVESSLKDFGQRITFIESNTVLYAPTLWEDLEDWGFAGKFAIANSGVISVSESSIGGYYIGGYSWESYLIEFKAQSLSTDINWIIRASKQHGEVSVLFENEKIIVHLHDSLKNVVSTESERIPFQLDNSKEYRIETFVCKNKLSIKINTFKVFEKEILGSHPIGTFGFRNPNQQILKVKKLKVKLLK